MKLFTKGSFAWIVAAVVVGFVLAQMIVDRVPMPGMPGKAA